MAGSSGSDPSLSSPSVEAWQLMAKSAGNRATTGPPRSLPSHAKSLCASTAGRFVSCPWPGESYVYLINGAAIILARAAIVNQTERRLDPDCTAFPQPDQWSKAGYRSVLWGGSPMRWNRWRPPHGRLEACRWSPGQTPVAGLKLGAWSGHAEKATSAANGAVTWPFFPLMSVA